MRPGQNSKRMRGRPGSRKGPNPLTRSYESSGPDVKIRGTAHHISEKYLQLARDAQASGDPVMAESYLQHAEHYFRLIAAAQQPQQGPGMYHGQSGDPNLEDVDDLEFGAMPDRFASPLERPVAPPHPANQPSAQAGASQPVTERPFQGNGDRQGFPRPERGHRPERPFQERAYRDRDYQASPEKPYQEQRPYLDRNGRSRDQEGNSGHGRGPRDYRNEPSIRVDQRAETRTSEAGAEANTLPAFITAPVRVSAESHDPAPPLDAGPGLRAGQSGGDVATDGFHPRPRRRRGAKAEADVTGLRDDAEANATDSVQD
jgi:Domain of unknown function (DUF4167)